MATLAEHSIVCKYCGSQNVAHCGIYKNVPRYLCKSCHRKFKADRNVFYMRVPVEYVALTMEMYYKGAGIVEIKDTLKERYNFYPSRAVLYRWIYNFTGKANQYFRDLKPVTGDAWIIGEEVKKMAGGYRRIYDIIDIKTGFILASHIAPTVSVNMMRGLFERAVQKAGIRPQVIHAFMVYSHLEKYKNIFNCRVEHISMEPAEFKYNLEFIENITRIYDDRRKIINRVRSPDTLKMMFEGWQTYYNFLATQKRLGNLTPAEAAGIRYQATSWKDAISCITAINNRTDSY